MQKLASAMVLAVLAGSLWAQGPEDAAQIAAEAWLELVDNELYEASWEEAYNLIANRFSEIKSESGPDAFVLWASGRATNESNYMMQKFARAVIGTNNIDNCART